jgi:lauroyl/myristoyl acyltransferase
LSASDPTHGSVSTVATARQDAVPRRWTLHGLNNGRIFDWTCRGVSLLPRSASYAIGHVGSWIAWRAWPHTREALADNLTALFPHASQRELHARALETLRSYTRDVIDFLRAIEVPADRAAQLFEVRERDGVVMRELLAQERGIILVTGHYGNWEIGGVFMRRVFDVPLTVVAMAEANEEVNRIRHEIRGSLGLDTIEVRRSFDTALQIRRRLADNHIVAMLMDRHMGRDRVEVTLLGRRAWFLRTPVLMAHLTGAPLLPCFIERIGRARFRIQQGEPIFVSHDKPREDAIREAAQRFADQLDAKIREHPSLWYHFYPYWKAQTDDYDALT